MCKLELSVSEYWNSKTNKNGLASYCKKCASQKYKNWFSIPENKAKRALGKRVKTPEDSRKRRNQRLKKEYGMTVEDYDRMLKKQDNKCAICGTDKPAGKGKLYIDHNHTTNQVRDLLCIHCNNLIGHCFESKERLQLAIEYLTKWENKS